MSNNDVIRSVRSPGDSLCKFAVDGFDVCHLISEINRKMPLGSIVAYARFVLVSLWPDVNQLVRDKKQNPLEFAKL